MGGPAYNHQSRSVRTAMFAKQSFDDTFEQQRKKRMHESMDPRKAMLRESRDSEVHPLSLPILFGLDITGSMQDIPHHLVKDGLPDMIKKLMERGVDSPAILFAGIGDSKNDRCPFQVGQFESGDAELDLWLTRTYIEGDGGGNGGESYLWAWYFAAKHCVTDAWEKRGQKGFIFTVGNEPCHPEITSSEFRDVMGLENQETTTKQQLYNDAKEKWNIFHVCVNNRPDACPSWKEFLGDNALVVTDYRDIPNLVADTIAKHVKKELTSSKPDSKPEDIKITL